MCKQFEEYLFCLGFRLKTIFLTTLTALSETAFTAFFFSKSKLNLSPFVSKLSKFKFIFQIRTQNNSRKGQHNYQTAPDFPQQNKFKSYVTFFIFFSGLI